jgi:drug/metabolite transporter (DMT)-like permease
VEWGIGIALAFASALTTNVGFLLRHRGASAAPDVDIRHPLRTVLDLFRQKWWTIGYVVAIVAWLLHVGALKLVPLSLVQAALASGFVILGVVAERFFGFKLGRRQWLGIGLTAVGLALLAVTAASTPKGEQSSYGVMAAIGFLLGLVIVGALLIAWGRTQRMSGREGVMLGAAAGLLFTVSHIGVKALTGSLSFGDASTLLTPWVPVVIAAFVAAFFASARSLQVGDAVSVIAVTGVASNASAMLAGVVVFRDPVGDSELLIALRIMAFALVIIAAALLPAPVRAAGMTGEGSGSGRAPRAEPAAPASASA